MFVVHQKLFKMELKDLIGEHYLSGIDLYDVPPEDSWGSTGNAFRFILDGITYEAIEDPSDGYRSQLKEIMISETPVNYNFPPQKVIGKMKDNDESYSNDVLEFYDPVTDKLVLAIGTMNWDDYYPWCVLDWHPENLNINN